MDILLGILGSLGVNETIWIQLAIFTLMFFFLSTFVFSPYVKAYEKRQESTTGNKAEAETIYAQNRELEALYQRKAGNLNADIKVFYDKARSEALGDQERIVSQAREKAKQELDKAKEKIQDEFNRAREALIKEAPELGEKINQQLLGKGL